MIDNRNLILDIIAKHHAIFCKEIEQLAAEHGKTYNEVAEAYDQLREKRKYIEDIK